MLITIHNSKLEKVAFIDNDKQDTLNFYNDKFSQYLLTASATFEFTVYKKGIKSDTIKEKAYQTLTERSFVSFKYNGRTYLFNVMSTEENDTEIHCYCENLNLELLNEYAGPYKSNNQLSFIEYCNLFSILKNGAITIGVNEVAEFRRTIEWTGQDTSLKRLLSIANNFDAEIEFVTHLKNDSSLKSFVMNIYRKNDGKNQGVGKRRDDIVLEYGKNIKNVKRKIDKTSIFNAVKPTGHATVTTTTTTVKQGANKLGTVSWSGGNLNYAGHNISSDVVGQILTLCTQHKLLPSGVFSQLYLESWWGASNVARVDNNWGGLTWTGNGNRPSGVVVTQGSARPASEGGYYMHFANLSDYFKDYTYLLAEQGIYKVKGADSIDAYTKGLFRVGGATYDYAAAGYDHYAPLMRDIRSGINRSNNNAMDNLDNQYRSVGTVGTAPVSQIASKTKSVLDALTAKKGQLIGSGQCYALSAWYAQSIGGPGLGGGVTSLRGLIGAGMAASQIGTDYNWAQFGWKVAVPNKIADLIPGSIANIKANFNGGFLNTTGWGHTVVIKAISGDTLTVLEQNFAGHQYVEERTYSASAYLGAIQTLCYPPEIVQGKRIDGTTQVPPEQQNTETSTSTQEKILEIRPDLYREYKNDAGQVEFYVKNGAVYAPISKDLYPSAFTGIETDDNWIRKDFDIQTDSEEVLIQEAIKLLKKNAYPEITYEVEGYSTDLSIGDTVKIYDKSFSPKLILEARVTEQHTSFTNPSQNKSVFDNFKALESKISSMLTDRMNEMVEEQKPFDLRLITDNGTSFKNGEGISVLTAELWKNNKKFGATYQFKSGDKLLSAGLELMVKAIDLTPNEPLIITVDAYIGNDFIASKQVTFINVNDGLNGSKGADGNGIASSVVAYQAGASATVAPTGTWSSSPVSVPAGQFLWTRTIFTYTDTTTKTIYNVSRQGQDGANGKDGQNGQIPHIAYADITEIVKQSDPEFKIGANTLTAYNNLANGNVVMERITAESDAPSNSGYMLKISNIGTASPGLGGVKFGNVVNSNEVYIYTIVAKIPIGYTIEFATNSIGNDGTRYFLTSTAGTGKYETYKYQVNVGTLSTASSSGYFFINGSQVGTVDAPINWYIAFANYSLISANNFSIAPLNSTHIGVYVDDLPSGSTDWKKYAWTLTKGQKGDQGLPGTPGADGKTPYWHTAWANSADGKTDFSLTDSKDKQFRGEYIDYIQADSTDPTKYNWIDRTGNVKVGGSNILLNSRFENTSTDPYSFTVGGVTYNTKPDYWSLYNSGIPNATTSYHAYVDKSMSVTNVIAFNESDGSRNWKAINQTVSSRVPNTSKNFMISLDMYATGAGTKAYGGFYYVSKSTGAFNFHAGQFNIVPSAIGKWVRESAKVPFNPDDCDFTKEIRFYIYGYGFTTNSILYIDKVMLENSTVASVHSDAPEELKAIIDSKADQALTQEQLNLLLETQNLMTAEMRTKATAEQVDALIASYNKYVSDEAVNKANVEAELIANAERIEAFRKDYDDKMLQLDFVSNYMRATDLGLEVSASDGSSSLLVQKDRISMFSAGKEVMYISQGFIHIDNGVFTKTLQIGNFRESQADGDPTTNLTIYVG